MRPLPSDPSPAPPGGPVRTVHLRVRGTVQGVGFRPTVFRLASEEGLEGRVANDGDGVTILVRGPEPRLDAFVRRLAREKPPLAVIDAVEREERPDDPTLGAFRIVESARTGARTDVAPDAATCAACLAEVRDPTARRHRHPFANCTHCGPRFTIVRSLPYDRPTTTMAAFPMCAACRAEYEDPGDRRFHAQPIACPACGPRVWLERADGAPFDRPREARDDVEHAAMLLSAGEILAVKGVGGFHLACDATNEAAVAALRRRKARLGKPFALMARDLDVVARHVRVGPEERALLEGPAAPIVLLEVRPDGAPVAPSVAPGHRHLGLMLPYTPLHHLLLERLDRPIVLTSGNRSDEPQCIDDAEARARLGGIATWLLFHDRAIENRVDDSVVRLVGGAPQVLRRARGHAPAPLRLPPGFEAAPPLFAAGGDLKNAFALVLGGGRVLVAPHLGDLEHPAALAAWGKTLELLRGLFAAEVALVAVDAHPGYVSHGAARALAARWGVPVVEVQHHHAHAAACLAEHGVPLDAPPSLALVLDGLGWGADGTVWGGELFLADYRRAERLGALAVVPMIGGDRASRQPWRNLYAHLAAALGWEAVEARHGDLPCVRHLRAKPLALVEGARRDPRLSPPASSAGRLFDAVAAAVGIHPDGITYEGQAAMELEAAVDPALHMTEPEALAYPFSVRPDGAGLLRLDPGPLWAALLDDLAAGVDRGAVAARFHRGLARGLVALAHAGLATVARSGRAAPRRAVLTGGVFLNRILYEETRGLLEADGFEVLAHHVVPAGDGGVALGQAAVASARWLARTE